MLSKGRVWLKSIYSFAEASYPYTHRLCLWFLFAACPGRHGGQQGPCVLTFSTLSLSPAACLWLSPDLLG